MTEKNTKTGLRYKRFSVLLIVLISALSLLFMSCDKKSGTDDNSVSSGELSSESTAEMTSTSEPLTSAAAETESSTASITAGSTKPVTTGSTAAAVTDSVFSEADQLYFKDCVFIGDSITTGIESYGVTKYATVLAEKGLNTSSTWGATLEKYKSDVSRIKPKYIYVMFGSNDIGHISYISEDKFIDNYDIFVKGLINASPESKIYLQSVFPVTSKYENNNPNYKNEIIDRYNLRIRQIAADNNVLYLNVAEALKDENNDLRQDIAPGEGMHIEKKGYYIWINYILGNRSVEAVTE